MDLVKILELLKIDSLDESVQTEVKDRLQKLIETQIELKLEDRLEEALESEKEKLVEVYEEKFEDYKDTVVERFSDWVDQVLEDELVIPDQVLEYAKIGERYSDLFEQFKLRLSIDEGKFDNEALEIIQECKSEIINLKERVDELTSRNLVLEKDIKDVALEAYILELTSSLPEKEKKYTCKLLEGLKTKDEIDEKFELITESTGITCDFTDKEDINIDDRSGVTLTETDNSGNSNSGELFKKFGWL